MTRHNRIARAAITFAMAFALLGTTQAFAQCSNLTGNPAPTLNTNLVQKLVLNDGPSNVFGDGDDRFKYSKGIFVTAAPFNPTVTDDLSISFNVNTSAGPLMFNTTIPAGAAGWSVSPPYFNYSDNTSPFGIFRVYIRELSPNNYLIKKVIGRNDTINNAPLTLGQNLQVMWEVESSGVGICDESILTDCNNAGVSCRP